LQGRREAIGGVVTDKRVTDVEWIEADAAMREARLSLLEASLESSIDSRAKKLSKRIDKLEKPQGDERLKTIEAAIKKLIGQYEELNQGYTQHICTPDAHNPGILARKK
jgi:hypothetical protein